MLKKLLFLAVLGGIAAAVAKKLQAGSTATAGGGWQSSYDPAPAPSAPASPAGSSGSSGSAGDASAAVTEEDPAVADVPPPPVDIPPAKTDVDPLTDPLPDDEQA